MILKRKASLVLFVLALTSTPALRGQTDTSPSNDNRIEIPTKVTAEVRGMTTDDILSLREPADPQISPDGRTVAFVVRQAFLDTNDSRSALFTIAVDGDRAPVKWLEEKGRALSQIRWAPGGEYITFLSGQAPGIFRIDRAGGKPARLFDHDGGVSRYEWSADGKAIAFISRANVSPEARRKLEEQGIVYEDYMSVDDLIAKSWPKTATEMWIYDVAQRKARKITERWSPVYGISDFAFSPTGKHIAFSYHRPGSLEPLSWDIDILSTGDGGVVKQVNWEGRETLPSWSPDGLSIAFLSTGEIPKNTRPAGGQSIYVVGLNESRPRVVSRLEGTFRGGIRWSKDGKQLLIERDNRSLSSLYESSIPGTTFRKVSESSDHLSEFSFNASQSMAACLRQNPTMSPEVAIMGLADGRLKTLTGLNPQVAGLKLGAVSEVRWTNKYNNKANGFLIKPVGYVEGRRYPFLVMLYDFTSKYISHAQWVTSYPPQVFASKGYAVLLMNFPENTELRNRETEGGLRYLVYNGLDSILKGAERVVEMGVADPARQGIMGWSRGCFMTSVTITQSDVFRVASAGDGFLFSPASYWWTHDIFQNDMETYFGGPPYGQWYKYYEQVAPTLRADRVRVPVLLEYVAKNARGVEFHTALRAHGVPSEYVAYPDETHSFSQPKHRMASMARNLDWFDFWLLGKEADDPAKREQYRRWTKMKDAWKKAPSVSVRSQ